MSADLIARALAVDPKVKDKWAGTRGGNSTAYDIIVVGGTEAGHLAAVSAARLGRSVLLALPGSHIGWMTGGGVNWQDVEPDKTSGVVNGLAREFLAGVAERETPDRSFVRHWRAGGWSRPRWWRRAWAKILAHPNITILRDAPLISVQKSGLTITSVTLPQGTFFADVFVEGTDTGDLVRLAGLSYSLGREASALYGEGGKAGIKAPAAWPGGAAIDPYVTPGQPASGLIYGVDPAPAGTVGAADGRVMAFGYRLFLTSVTADKIPFPAPDMTGSYAYDPARYELLARAFAAAPAYYDDAVNGLGRIFQFYDISPTTGSPMGSPKHSYVDLNSGGPISTNYPNTAECLEYVTATTARRAEIAYNAKQWILGLLYWLLNSNDPRIPAVIKTALAAYGFSNKEYGSTGGFPPNFYVREGCRMVGDFVANTTTATLANGTPYPIGYLHYGFDSHYVRRLVSGGVVVPEGAMLNGQGTNYGSPIPLEILLPKAAECSNMVSVSQTSTSRAYWCSLRAIPSMLQIGPPGGVVAAIASAERIAVQAVDRARVCAIIDIQGVTDGQVIDTTGTYSAGSRTESGTAWTTASSRFGGIALNSQYKTTTGPGQNSQITFAPNILETGAYEVLICYPPAQTADPDGVSSQSRATNTKITINHADGTSVRRVDQRWPNGRGGRWESLGIFTFTQGLPSTNTVVLDASDSDGNVVISAVKVVKLGRVA